MDLYLSRTQMQKKEYTPLNDGWQLSVFPTMDQAYEFAMERGWTAKPQRVQVRHTEEGFIVERYDPNGCGCGG